MYTEKIFGPDYLRMRHHSLDALTAEHLTALSEVLGIDDANGKMRLLDLGCGPGRLAVAFAERGHDVVGVDQSDTLLTTAAQLGESRGVSVRWVRSRYADMPQLGKFDGIYCWSTSFGYGTDEENETTLRRCREMLPPGGRFALETSNWARWPRPFEPVDMEINGDDWMICQSTFDPATARQTVTEIYCADGKIVRDQHSIRRFWPSELAFHLETAGFREVELLGEDLQPISTEHGRIIAVATA